MPTTPSCVLALDVGQVRIGVALASLEARLARPLVTLANDESFVTKLRQLITEYGCQHVVIGLPRNLSGDDTPQTAYVRQFADKLAAAIDTPLVWQDEAVTSAKAEAELQARGKGYTKGDIDALSAAYILEDYLGELPR